MRTPEELAEQFVSQAHGEGGGSRHVRLSVPGSTPVRLRPHPNPALVRDDVAAVRQVVAAAIRAGRASGSAAGSTRPPGAGE